MAIQGNQPPTNTDLLAMEFLRIMAAKLDDPTYPKLDETADDAYAYAEAFFSARASRKERRHRERLEAFEAQRPTPAVQHPVP